MLGCLTSVRCFQHGSAVNHTADSIFNARRLSSAIIINKVPSATSVQQAGSSSMRTHSTEMHCRTYAGDSGKDNQGGKAIPTRFTVNANEVCCAVGKINSLQTNSRLRCCLEENYTFTRSHTSSKLSRAPHALSQTIRRSNNLLRQNALIAQNRLPRHQSLKENYRMLQGLCWSRNQPSFMETRMFLN